MEGKDMTLKFIDHVEIKVTSPDREKLNIGQKSATDFQCTEDSVDPNRLEQGTDKMGGENLCDESKLNTSETFTYEYTLNEDDIALLKAQSSIDSENKVTMEKICDDSGYLESEMPQIKDEKRQVMEDISKNLIVEESQKLTTDPKGDSTFDFISHTSNILLFERSQHTEQISRKRKELSPLTIGEEGGTEVAENIQKESVPQQCSEDLVAAEAPLSPKTYTKDSDQHLIFEEDEENVIIHFDTDFEQKSRETQKMDEKKVTNLQYATKEKTAEIVSTSALSSKAPIEVERKFTVTADTKIRLLEFGAKLKQEIIFEDAYYDNSEYTLTLSDCWLRKRNDKWEFKVAVSSFQTKSNSSQYAEITDENEISRLLCRYLHFEKKLLELSLDDLADQLKLTVFARFSTTRQSYFLPECTIDLDLSDFGFQVGEIEVIVADEKRITDALQTIDSMANKLGFESLQLVPGHV